MKINAALRFMQKPCELVEKLLYFFKISSFMIGEVVGILKDVYDIHSLFDNDPDAISSRIQYVQNHEQQMRLTW